MNYLPTQYVYIHIQQIYHTIFEWTFWSQEKPFQVKLQEKIQEEKDKEDNEEEIQKNNMYDLYDSYKNVYPKACINSIIQ